MELKRLEMDIILLMMEGTVYTMTDDYSISIVDDDVIVKLKNKDLTINLDKVIVFQARKFGNDAYKFQVKSEYLRFDDQKHIKESYLYRRLYGYSMNTDYKRLLIFLGSLNRKEISKYLSLVPNDAMCSIRKFFESDSFGGK